MASEAAQEAGWPLRTWALMVLGALFALMIQQLSDLPDSGWVWGKRLVFAAIIFLATSGVAFGLSWRRDREFPCATIAAMCGIIAGGVTLWNGTPPDSSLVFWPICSGFVAAIVLLILFQAADARHPHLPERWSWASIRDWKRQALVYSDVHETAWTDALLGGISGIFTGIVIAIAFLLAHMFELVEIKFLRDLLREEWFFALLAGGAYGGGMGLLRDRVAIIAALQRVAMIVLRVLAPVLAVGLVAFLAVLPFTGLAPLWATGETTPIMLSAAMVALFLVNAVIGDKAEDVAGSRALRWGAMALALAMLPLVLIAVWSTGLRIGQYGFSPDRLWALMFVILATITAIAYAVAIARRGDWVARLYRSNLHLAFLLGGVAFFLSTSIVSFERVSAADQIARLESGRIKPLDFDYRGLWYRFGPPGKAAIKRLAAESKDANVRRYAIAAQNEELGELPNELEKRSGVALDKRLTMLPTSVALDPELRDLLSSSSVCGEEARCLVRFLPGNRDAVVVKYAEPCGKETKQAKEADVYMYQIRSCSDELILVYRDGDAWKSTSVVNEYDDTDRKKMARVVRLVKAVREGRAEMRIVQQRQLFVDAEALGDVIPMDNAAKP